MRGFPVKLLANSLTEKAFTRENEGESSGTDPFKNVRKTRLPQTESSLLLPSFPLLQARKEFLDHRIDLLGMCQVGSMPTAFDHDEL